MSGRAIAVIAVLAAVVMLTAAANFTLVFVLFSSNHQAGRPGTDLLSNLPLIAVGVLPYLVTAGFLIVRRRRARHLILISAIALPIIFVIGFWTGFGASALELPEGGPSAEVLNVYQFTFLASVAADAAVLVVSLISRNRDPV